MSCPLDCVYLREARLHEKPPNIDPKQLPNSDIRVTDSFLHDNELLLAFTMSAVAAAGLETPGAVDFDVREALDALVRTYRTLDSGLYYESKPSNLVAAAVHERVQRAIDEFRKAAEERYGLTTVRDTDVLGVLAFLQRVEYQINNGRKRGRAFLDFLVSQSAQASKVPGGSSLVVP